MPRCFRTSLLVAILSLLSAGTALHASVSWDSYILRIENEMVFIKSGADVAVACHMSRLAIINDQLIIEYGGEIFKCPVNAQTKIAIIHEIERACPAAAGKGDPKPLPTDRR